MSNIFDGIQQNFNTPTVNMQPSQQVASNPVVKVEDSIPSSAVKSDTLEISNNKPEKKEKKGIIRSFKGFIAGIKKFFATSGAYVKGGAKSIAAGAIGGSIVYTGGAAINAIRNRAVKGTDKVIKKIPNKALAFVVAAGALVVNLWTASLNATQKQSEIDLRYTGLNNNK